MCNTLTTPYVRISCAGGLTLKECKVSIDSQLDKALLGQRLQALDEEIAAKLDARKLLTSLLDRIMTL